MQKLTYLYDVSDLNVYNVSGCVKDGEAIKIIGVCGHRAIYSWGHNSFVGVGEAHAAP